MKGPFITLWTHSEHLNQAKVNVLGEKCKQIPPKINFPVFLLVYKKGKEEAAMAIV